MKLRFPQRDFPRLNPAQSEIEIFGSYAGKEDDFLAWASRIAYDIGRGLAMQ
jgi:hypothetical protein